MNQTDSTTKPQSRLYRTIAQIIRTADLTPRMRRITLGGEGLRPLVSNCWTADAIKLYIPELGRPPFIPRLFMLPSSAYKPRAYTIRRFDAAALELDIDILLHGDTPGSVWARSVQPGDQIGFLGPRHEFEGITASQCVFAGDESALPAIAAILEQLSPDAHASVFVEVDDAADEIPLTSPAQLDVIWLHRGARHAAQHDLLEPALRSFRWSPDRVYVWVCGETGAVNSIRRFLRDERKIDKKDLHLSGYWR